MDLNFRQLECFFSLAKTLNFSKTGLELKIAQPAVSKHIRGLEESLGVQLFLRTKKTVELTQKGKEFLERMGPFGQGIKDELNDFLADSNSLRGELHIGCLNEVGERVFLPIISQFSFEYPEVEIHVHYLKTFEIVEGVKNGSIHVGVTPQFIDEESIRSYNVANEEIVLVTGKGSKNLKEKLTDLNYVAYRKNDPLLSFYLKKTSPRAQMSKLNIPFYVNSHKSMIDVLKTHPYYAVLPRHSVREALKKKELFEVGKKSFKSSLYLFHRDLDIKDKKVEIFRQYLLKALKNAR